MAEQPSSERSIFLAAIEHGAAAERAAFLERACGGDRRLRADVEALLAAHDRLGDITPVPDATRTGVDAPGPAVGEQPGAEMGPYRLLQELGAGGMGTVFLAEQREPVQ